MGIILMYLLAMINIGVTDIPFFFLLGFSIMYDKNQLQ